MNNFVELDSVAQVSVTLAAFTSLLAALRGGDIHEWEPRPRLGFWLLLTYSLASLLFSLLPGMLRDFAVEPWRVSIALQAAFHAVGLVVFVGRHVSLTRAGMRSQSNALWVTISAVMAFTFAALCWSLLGGLGGASYRVYHFGVVACLLVAVGAFVGFLRLGKPTT